MPARLREDFLDLTVSIFRITCYMAAKEQSPTSQWKSKFAHGIIHLERLLNFPKN